MQTSFSISRRKAMRFSHQHYLITDKDTNNNEEKEIEEDEEVELFTQLLPGLPNHLAQQCLSALDPALLFSVCKSWRRFIYSSSFPPFPSLYAQCTPRTTAPSASSSSSYCGQVQRDSIEFFCLDPISSVWKSLPKPPLASPLNLLHHHPSFISRKLPIQSITVSGRLVLIAATDNNLQPALSRPLGFDPLLKRWFLGPPLPTPRRWCITGSVGGAVYVASGMGSSYHSDVAKSLEKWDLKEKETEWRWQKMAAYRDGRFSREAIEAVGLSKGNKLCMVNVKGNSVKAGALYDVEMDQWEEMPAGMLSRWNGAAAVDEDEGVIYAVDEAKGALRKYNMESDSWEELIVSENHLKGAEQIAAGRGRVCVVCAGGERIVVVDVVAEPPRIWVVNPPEEMEVVSVHIMPRMCQEEEFS